MKNYIDIIIDRFTKSNNEIKISLVQGLTKYK